MAPRTGSWAPSELPQVGVRALDDHMGGVKVKVLKFLLGVGVAAVVVAAALSAGLLIMDGVARLVVFN